VPQPPKFELWDDSDHRIVVTAESWERETAENYHDLNWVSSSIRMELGPVRATVRASFLTTEFRDLLEGFEALVDGTSARFEYGTLEPYLEIDAKREGRRILVEAEIDVSPGLGPWVSYSFDVRVDRLMAAVEGLREICASFRERKESYRSGPG
jgi:hypothetical protein